MQIELSLLVSVLAIIVSLYSLYRQYEVKGARIELLNTEHNQRCVVRQYAGLPKIIQDDFPNYADQQVGYALVELVFGNSGDRAGLASIANVEISGDHGLFKKSYYSYVLIPAYEIVEKPILFNTFAKTKLKK